MADILLTGATGLIGSHLAASLAPEHEIVALGRRKPAVGALTWIQHDLASPDLPRALPENVRTIIYLAQSHHFRQFPEKARDIFEVNLAAVQRLLDWGRKVGIQRFIYASSGGIYGHSENAFQEGDPPSIQGKLRYYYASKYCAELLANSYSDALTIIILRPFFVYGPGQQGMLIPKLLEKVSKGETIVIEGNPGVRINPIFVEDAVEAVRAALDLPTSDVFNIAGDEVVTMTDLVKLMGNVLGKGLVIDYKDIRVEGNLVGDNGRMKRILGVFPRTPLGDGLRKTLKMR